MLDELVLASKIRTIQLILSQQKLYLPKINYIVSMKDNSEENQSNQYRLKKYHPLRTEVQVP